MPIAVSSFTYPWDLVDIGVPAALERMRNDGLTAIDLTVCYHPVTAMTPAPGRRLMMIDEGGVFFPARVERYGRIKPQLWPDERVLRAWPAVAEAAGSLQLNGWTVCMFQPWMARAFPDCSRTLPTGQAIPNAVCPASPDVREFMATLVGDLVSQFPISLVQLEGVTSLRFDAGWRVPRILVDLTDWQRRLLSICFCPSCVTAGHGAGINVAGLQTRINEALQKGYVDNGLERGRSAEEVHLDWCAQDDDYAGYVPLRDDASVALVDAIADTVEAESPATEIGVWAPNEFDGTPLDLERILPRVRTIQTRSPGLAPIEARAAQALAASHPGLRVRTVQWCGGYIGPSFGPEFIRALEASVALPSDEINLFNWAMLSPGVAEQIVPLIRRLERDAAEGRLEKR